MGTPLTVHVRYVVVDGPEGDELLRRQLNVIREVLRSLVRLAERCGLPDLVGELVRLPASKNGTGSWDLSPRSGHL
jgi:hypothetical protein